MATSLLIIEDDPDIRRGLSVQLRARGYAPEAAPDAITGQALAVKTKPAVILLDLGLPGGGGLPLLQRLKTLASTASIPVIVLTARDPQHHEREALAMGAAAFFQKPPDMVRLTAAIAEQVGVPAAPPPRPAGRATILIVEDDPDTRMGLSVRLRTAGFDTVFAGDAATALGVAQSARPDLVLLDLGLPAGGGFAVLERMRRNAAHSSTPVIVLSARDPEVNRPRALEAGARAYFHKPADMPALLEAIQAQLPR